MGCSEVLRDYYVEHLTQNPADNNYTGSDSNHILNIHILQVILL